MTALRQIWDCPEAAEKKTAAQRLFEIIFVLFCTHIFIYLAHHGKTKQHPHRFDLGFRFVWVCALSWVCKCMNYICMQPGTGRQDHPSQMTILTIASALQLHEMSQQKLASLVGLCVGGQRRGDNLITCSNRNALLFPLSRRFHFMSTGDRFHQGGQGADNDKNTPSAAKTAVTP